jgi:hypothetical protein
MSCNRVLVVEFLCAIGALISSAQHRLLETGVSCSKGKDEIAFATLCMFWLICL